MATKVLILGESGTGKSTSMMNCDPNIIAVVNPVGKPLPFKGGAKYDTLDGVTDCDLICDWMKKKVAEGKKMIVVDDFQYILAVPYMDRIKESGWDKYNDFGANYFKVIQICNELPKDVTVYYMTHVETLENGLTTVKLIGKLLREKITIEGLFTIVLRTACSEGKYYFYTQNSGKDTVKSPIGMFDNFSIDNDLNYVDQKIRSYYEIGTDFKSEEEMKVEDARVAGDVELEDVAPRKKRERKKRDIEPQGVVEDTRPDNPIDVPANIPDDVEEVEFTEAVEPKKERPSRRRRA